MEGYVYDWSKHVRLAGWRPLTLMQHVGGAPILFGLVRAPCSVSEYDTLVKWIQKLYDYVGLYTVARWGPEPWTKIRRMKQRVDPHLIRLDNANRRVLSALRDGQVGFVVDAKTTSRRWCAAMPVSDRPLPLLACAIVAGASDADRLADGMETFRALIDDALEMLHEPDPDQFPMSELPRRHIEAEDAGMTTLFALPERWKLDKKLTPTIAVSDKVAAVSMTRDQARRLLTPTPLMTAATPLADPHRPLAMAASFDFAALVDAVEPWVDYAIAQEMQDGDPQADSFPWPSLRQQLKSAMQILRCFRGVTFASYFEDKTLVTHFEWRFTDLD